MEEQDDKKDETDHERLCRAAKKIRKELGLDSLVIIGTRMGVDPETKHDVTSYFMTWLGNIYACRSSAERFLHREKILDEKEFHKE